MEDVMKRDKGLAGQMAEQMYIPKNAAKGMLAKAKKMNDRDGFAVGGVGIGSVKANDMTDLRDMDGNKVYPVIKGKIKMFTGGGSAKHSSGQRRLQQSKVNRKDGGVARRAGAAIRGFTFEGIF